MPRVTCRSKSEDLLMSAEELVGINKKEVLRAEIDDIGLEELMDPITAKIGPSETVNDALKRMRDHDLHELPVSEDGKKLLGVISYGTLLRRKNLSVATKVETIMITPQRISVTTPITQVAEFFLMSGFRQVPVLNKEMLAGMTSRSAMLKLVGRVRELSIITVGQIMSPDVRTVHLDSSVPDAVQAMKNLDVRVLPVVDDLGRIVGVVGIRDIANFNWHERNRATVGELSGDRVTSEVTVGSVMVEPPVVIKQDTTLLEAARLMLDRNISSLPVVDGSKIQGILTKYDIVELIASLRQRNMVYTQISGLGEDDRFALDMMTKEIETSMKKISPIETPLLFNLHVGAYNDIGMRNKYTLHARLTTDDRVYTGSSVDWDLIRATSDLMQKLERRVIEHKEEKIQHRRKSRNIGHY
jgi:CBS domain-containing protein